MKKILLSALVLFGLIGSAQAQDTFDKGTGVLSAGIGIGSSLYGDHYSMRVPPISLAYDHCVVSNLINGNNGSIGIGGFIGFTSSTMNVLVTLPNAKNYTTTSNYLTLGARGSFHYQFVSKLDTYAGLMLGYYFMSTRAPLAPTELRESSAGGLGWSSYIGARYYFTPAVAAFAELGYGVSFLTLGASFKF